MPRSSRFIYDFGIEHVMNSITGRLVENRIVVWSIEESRALFGNGSINFRFNRRLLSRPRR
jgi:hypothetical protein